MKKILLFLLLIIFSSILFGQVTYVDTYSNFIIINGDTVYIDPATTQDDQIIMRIGGKWINTTPNYSEKTFGYIDVIPVTGYVVSVDYPNAMSYSNYYLDIKATYETTTSDGKVVNIEQAIYDTTKTRSGFIVNLTNPTGVLRYIAIDSVELNLTGGIPPEDDPRYAYDSLYIKSNIRDLQAEKVPYLTIEDAGSYSGFIEGSNISVSYNHTNRTITLDGNIDYY